MALLRRRDVPILHFVDLPLYEDDLPSVWCYLSLRSSIPEVAAPQGSLLPTYTGNAHRAEHEKLPTYPRVWDKGE